MSLLSLILALALEQWRPLSDRRVLLGPLERYAAFLERTFNAGERHHGIVAWCLGVLPPVIAAWVLFAVAYSISPLVALAFNVGVLYLTIGFRQESHFFTDVHAALKDGDLDRARRILGEWRGASCDGLSASDIARLAVESALSASHRYVFGAIFWFVLLPGPTGAVLYRVAEFFARRWSAPQAPDHVPDALGAEVARVPITTVLRPGDPNPETEMAAFGEFARQAFYALDWLPVRVTAAAFAVVGDFEDAVYCWRTQASRWPDKLLGVVLASGAGALGVRIGMPIIRNGTLEDRPDLGLGDDADTAFLDSTVGLVWRSLVLWIAMLLVIAVARAVS
jgi:cobalamin biosynthesis protein CobD/CbiB